MHQLKTTFIDINVVIFLDKFSGKCFANSGKMQVIFLFIFYIVLFFTEINRSSFMTF